MSGRIEVLDHGYVQFIESWGSDERIIEAARMSTKKGFEGWGSSCSREGCGVHRDSGTHDDGKIANCFGGDVPHNFSKPGDEKLLRYLWENKHATPFEMAGAIIEVQAPIFVFREWHRHRTQSYNEMSARYTPLPDLNYVPTVERLMAGGGHLTKQAGTVKGAHVLTEVAAEHFRRVLAGAYAADEEIYQGSLSMGVPKELARLCLPVGRYSRMRASANLRNWLGFLTLRNHPAAQYEIRVYAQVVHQILSGLFPRTLGLFDEKAG